MAKTRSMTRSLMFRTRSVTTNQNHDDAPSKKRIKNHDESSRNSSDGVEGPWSNLNHDVLYSIMIHLGVVDFVAFSGVCKSWRSFALSNRYMFMASRPPMSLLYFSFACENTCYLNLKDFEGRSFKTVIPHVFKRTCVGLTCGYLILYESKTRDFWLVNPITRHQLHFPVFPDDIPYDMENSPTYLPFKAILVFSPSTSGWLFAITQKNHDQIWFSRAGKGVWNHVSAASKILDLHAFKGKIYALNLSFECNRKVSSLCEVILGPEPKLMLLETNNFPCNYPEFVSSSENIFLKEGFYGDLVKVYQLDFGEMKWVFYEKTMEEYEFYMNYMYQTTAVKRESWWAGTDKIQKDKFSHIWMWYFPHDCLNVNLIDE